MSHMSLSKIPKIFINAKRNIVVYGEYAWVKSLAQNRDDWRTASNWSND